MDWRPSAASQRRSADPKPKTYDGWTVGGGLEYAFMNNWSAKLEYLYIDFGDGPTVPVTAAVNIVAGKMTDNIVRVGLNYKFF